MAEPEAVWREAVKAADAKQAKEIRVLDLRDVSSFADYFVICSGSNSRQIQAIADEIELRLKKKGERANSVEGYNHAEWVLMDYFDFVVHVFSDKARRYYDLERLWKSAKRLEVSELTAPAPKKRVVRSTATKRA